MGDELWDVLECKWTRQLIAHLSKGRARFNEIQRAVEVPTSTLSNRLTRLEDAGVVAREVADRSPPAVYYSLTDEGEELAGLIERIDAL